MLSLDDSYDDIIGDIIRPVQSAILDKSNGTLSEFDTLNGTLPKNGTLNSDGIQNRSNGPNLSHGLKIAIFIEK